MKWDLLWGPSCGKCWKEMKELFILKKLFYFFHLGRLMWEVAGAESWNQRAWLFWIRDQLDFYLMSQINIDFEFLIERFDSSLFRRNIDDLVNLLWFVEMDWIWLSIENKYEFFDRNNMFWWNNRESSGE